MRNILIHTPVLGTAGIEGLMAVRVHGFAAGLVTVRVSVRGAGMAVSQDVAVDPGGQWMARFDRTQGIADARLTCNAPVHVEASDASAPGECFARTATRLACDGVRRR